MCIYVINCPYSLNLSSGSFASYCVQSETEVEMKFPKVFSVLVITVNAITLLKISMGASCVARGIFQTHTSLRES